MKYMISVLFGLSIIGLLLAITGQLSKIYLAGSYPDFPADSFWIYNLNIWNWVFLVLILYLISLKLNDK